MGLCSELVAVKKWESLYDWVLSESSLEGEKKKHEAKAVIGKEIATHTGQDTGLFSHIMVWTMFTSLSEFRRDYIRWPRACLDLSSSQSGLAWGWCSVELFMYNRRDLQPGCEAQAIPGVRACCSLSHLLYTYFDKRIHTHIHI